MPRLGAFVLSNYFAVSYVPVYSYGASARRLTPSSNQTLILVKFQQRYQTRHRNSRSRTFAGGVASAVYEPVGSTPSPPHSLSGGMIALNHPEATAL
jgi:hypothetical protein